MKKSNFPTQSIFGIPVAKLNMLDTLLAIEEAIEEKRQLHHTVVNAGKIVAMQSDPELRESVLGADLINADGMAMVWASKLLGKSLPERVSGIELMENLVKMAHENSYKVFFLGAKQEVVQKCVQHYSEMYSPGIVAGYQNGYFSKEEEQGVAEQIADSGANILLIAMSSPMKEIFLEKYRGMISRVNMIMGVGGSLDVVSGKVKRAPVWMQNTGLEWFYRFIQEPRRMWKRYFVGNSKFVALTLKEAFTPIKYRAANPATT